MSTQLKPSKGTSETSYRNQSAQRVLLILEAFIGKDKVWSVKELAGELGMSINIVHRAMATLEEGGYVTRDSSGRKFQLGYQVLALTNGGSDEFDLSTTVRPYMQEIHDLTGESVFLSVIVGNNRVSIDKIEAKGPRVAHSQRSLSVPLHVGKTSRVLLACLTDNEIEEYLRFAPPLKQFSHLFVDAAWESNDDVWADINRIRRDGYIAWHSPKQYGGAYVAFPLQDSEGRPHAAISVGGPVERLSLERIMQIMPELQRVLGPLRQRCRLVPAPGLFLTKGQS